MANGRADRKIERNPSPYSIWNILKGQPDILSLIQELLGITGLINNCGAFLDEDFGDGGGNGNGEGETGDGNGGDPGTARGTATLTAGKVGAEKRHPPLRRSKPGRLNRPKPPTGLHPATADTGADPGASTHSADSATDGRTDASSDRKATFLQAMAHLRPLIKDLALRMELNDMSRDTKKFEETGLDEAFPSATVNPIPRRRIAVIGAVVALLAILLGIALIAAVREDSDPVVDQDARLGQAVDGMYGDLLRGDTRSAYQYRSERCRRALNEEQYHDAIAELFQGQDTAAGSIDYRVTARAPVKPLSISPSTGIDVPILEGYSRLWTLENGEWRYDSCE